MHVLMLDADCVDAHLFGHKLDAVVVVVQSNNVAQFCQTRWGLDRGCHVEWTGAYQNKNKKIQSKVNVVDTVVK